jgi:hypothetical protein
MIIHLPPLLLTKMPHNLTKSGIERHNGGWKKTGGCKTNGGWRGACPAVARDGQGSRFGLRVARSAKLQLYKSQVLHPFRDTTKIRFLHELNCEEPPVQGKDKAHESHIPPIQTHSAETQR